MIVLFDVNETLLNIDELQKKFLKYFEDKLMYKYFFMKLLHSSLIIGSIGKYQDFGTLSKITLKSIFEEKEVMYTDEVIDDILSTFSSLPPHKDVEEALKLLNKNNIKAIAVSNSSLSMLEKQLRNAGILDYFQKIYSVDSVKRYKPFSEIYNYVKNEEGVSEKEIFMIACHDWDLHGAENCGFNTGYISRSKSTFNPCYPSPDIKSHSLVEVVKEIIKKVEENNGE